MTSVITSIALFLTALLSMEAVAYLSHRYLMHGPLWFLHRSHHRAPRPEVGPTAPAGRHRLEANDLFGLLFAIPSIILIDLGARGSWPLLLPVGLGMTAYGAIYFLFHDIVVHRRIRLPRVPQTPYLRRIIKAHLVHHRTHVRDGAESFGFLYAPTTFSERPRASSPSTSSSTSHSRR